jgi:hypothetical protein
LGDISIQEPTERTNHMGEAAEFKSWAIVEAMGHVEYAG